VEKLNITSSGFGDNGPIPKKYTCDGEDVNPQLSIGEVPEGTNSLVLLVDDPDAPTGTWDHWVVWNIPPKSKIEEDTIPGVEGMNDFGKHSYGGSCPPSGTHRYFFKIYALDTKLSLAPNSRKKDVENAMKSHIVAKGELVGLYSNTRKT
jgi:Raf kinase inhibitor-like YbhB/YbcL family protein